MPPTPFGTRLGATLLDRDRCEFRVWAPALERVELHIVGAAERRIALRKNESGYHETVAGDCPAGTRYLFVLDGKKERPDPASRLQPEGVHRPSEVFGRDFDWTDRGWKGIPLEDLVIYELHAGTFSPEGTFDGVIGRLDHLKDLGITAVELLPVAQFPGRRNWGYDGTYVSAAQNSYGGPRALKGLVDACHARGMAILLDVVYNHLGPEGNYLSEFGPYFTDRYKTPWGLAVNFDGPQSDHVRWYFIHNALQWVDEFHFDGLRVDAVHAIVDHSAQPFLQDLCSAVRDRAGELGRRIHSIAESDLNDPRVITPKEDYGVGFDAQWSDDYHHSLHTLLTGESDGYYQGFGQASDLARVSTTGYLYVGQHSGYRGRRYGAPPKTKDGARFVVCAQNHDQIGNRMMGDRLSTLVEPAQLRLVAAAVVLSPFLPLLFMGEEYGETAPFLYFTSHSDAGLIEAVRMGRREEFDDFAWGVDPPDPHAEETFERSRLNWKLLDRSEHASLRDLYRTLLALRRETPALRRLDLEAIETQADDSRRILLVRRWAGDDQVLIAYNFAAGEQAVEVPFAPAAWKPMIESGAKMEAQRLTIPGWSFGLFRR
ncbi:MAG TPA: malto-oligosyltrehalose trehalohydrolase [Thermoanaerobaculia bacterium]|nr:malto-oligosyltrehalose trehalohydrolase [Thermoanaerobaculia bacterium]